MVGDRDPPKHSQFKPGNQEGKKGKRGASIVKYINVYLKQKLNGIDSIFKEDGAEMTGGELVAAKLLEKAIIGHDVSAIKELLDRVDGKVPQKNEHSGEDGGPIEHYMVSDEEMKAANKKIEDGF